MPLLWPGWRFSAGGTVIMVSGNGGGLQRRERSRAAGSQGGNCVLLKMAWQFSAICRA